MYMEKVLQELFGVHFFGCPYHSNGTKIHLDAALDKPVYCPDRNEILQIIRPRKNFYYFQKMLQLFNLM